LSYAIVADAAFVDATRHSGYKSTAHAVAELVDNALQAGAKTVEIRISRSSDAQGDGLEVAVIDDGGGMSPPVLRKALQFGGSSRLNDRSGLGRFGMGLPNSSLSQARRVEVFSWQLPGECFHSYLDVDEVISGSMRTIPVPVRARRSGVGEVAHTSISGTVVVWRRCDRLDARRAATLEDRLTRVLGRLFRYFLWGGVRICVNGRPVSPVDPLFLRGTAPIGKGAKYGDSLYYEVRVPRQDSRTSVVRVCFAELPVGLWHALSTDEKRTLGISGGAGVSIVRAGREVDYGWYFMGDKRREHYDDWWRCEVSFEPELDELFGIAHNKQQVSPTTELLALLSNDLSSVARTLSQKVRKSFLRVRHAQGYSSTAAASRQDKFLPSADPCGRQPGGRGVRRSRARAFSARSRTGDTGLYRIALRALREPSFFKSSFARDGSLVLTINTNHPFFARVYGPLRSAGIPPTRFHLECLLLALARAEVGTRRGDKPPAGSAMRVAWSDALAAFLSDAGA
jgi:hypothetical protein